MQKGDLACDPRGLIFEAYRIEGIEASACRSIFLDWAMGVPEQENPVLHIKELLTHYRAEYPSHPMTDILAEGSIKQSPPRRRKR